VNVVTTDPDLGWQLRHQGWPLIVYDGQGDLGALQVLQIIVAGQRRAALVEDLNDLAPRAFWTMEDLRPSAAPHLPTALVSAS